MCFYPLTMFAQMVKPSISMPNSMSNKPNFYADDDVSGGNKSAKTAASRQSSKNESAGKSGAGLPSKQSGQRWRSRPRSKQVAKTHPYLLSFCSSTTNSGWFGGIWNKLSLKPKNQMILPDDKNPTVSIFDPICNAFSNNDQLSLVYRSDRVGFGQEEMGQHRRRGRGNRTISASAQNGRHGSKTNRLVCDAHFWTNTTYGRSTCFINAHL